ncbi:MAG TPA: cysteine dioxygenase [Candidatus Limnocylindria bacterium]|jgi:predicted metal-dependent enzyme (double-stranded beta helix superfamily)
MPLDAFTRDLAAFHERFGSDIDRLVEATRERLTELVKEPALLPASACLGSPDRYTQHVLHVAPDRSHSVVALVWYPGQITPIHDHVSWCVVGVYEGTESQTLYHLAEDGGGVCLIETGTQTAGRGSCTSLVPPAENIHRVANAGAERAISIHVYGADIERLGSSINKTFDHLPVRELDGATRQAWRGR